MAGRGPTPLTQHQRSSDTKRRHAGTVTLADDGELRGPEFPFDVIPSPHPATVEWWDTWRRSPQAVLFITTDWQTLKRAARLQDDVMAAPRVSAAAVSELRLIEERFGATYADRQRARINVEAAAPSGPVAVVSSITDRRSKLADRLASAASAPSVLTEEPAPF